MPISNDLRAQAWANQSRLPLIALTLDHADLEEPIRVVNNHESVIVENHEYLPFPFEVSLPDALDDAPPRARLRIDNVTRELGQAVRSISTPATVELLVVRIEEGTDVLTGAVELRFPALRLTNVQLDAFAVEGALELESLVREPYPARIFSPAEFPGLV